MQPYCYQSITEIDLSSLIVAEIQVFHLIVAEIDLVWFWLKLILNLMVAEILSQLPDCN